MTILIILGAAFSVMVVSLSGVLFTAKHMGDWARERVTYLATFSAGVLIVLAYNLIEESLHESPSTAIVVAAVIAGALFLEIIHHLLPETHHHHEPSAGHTHTPVDGRRVLASDAVHNVTDGFLIVPAFLIDWRIGVAATAGILLHELVQEISEFFVLKQAGYSDRKALTLNFFSSSTILIGVALALVLASSELLLSILAGIAAGGFFSVVLRDLLPHAFESIKHHGRPIIHVIAFIVGSLLMFGVATLAPHEEFDEETGEASQTQQVVQI
ncbi:hypothetical protein COU18_02990 [Candidatus Kaiserbacteria bacterium CG10_big_fil_rev_8_21_14_0_10_51_14]|uniref:ZIP family metal transporter n=1 Tax=Candidatus Kaiserbacteria bacterium CG10_big_fil_rev_8_21_14_0_10_51_14 TaxID=1974610 RepID=A0A2H0UB22_9BACT|nr:MAG: hypothetical protein COU18_02990 [Candidatus Kaiserbacteria bacterium CG10_big_fil_rev_8_21_14_0_10_51_14]